MRNTFVSHPCTRIYDDLVILLYSHHGSLWRVLFPTRSNPPPRREVGDTIEHSFCSKHFDPFSTALFPFITALSTTHNKIQLGKNEGLMESYKWLAAPMSYPLE